jgi:preprotein translocase subunit SecF
MDIISKKYYFYFLSLMLIIFSVLSFYLFNPSFGIDLIGGQILEVKTKLNIDEILKNFQIKAVFYPTQNGYLIKSQEDLNLIWQEIQKKDPQSQKIRFESISSALSGELKRKSLLMIILVLLAIATYVAFAFYKMGKYFSLFFLALIVVITLFHDILITAGVYAFLAKFFNFEIDLKFITALLIIAGFSVHDTIVVFDRVRENILKNNKKDKEVFNLSLRQTFRRSLFTSLTTVLAILPLSIILPDLRAFLFSIQFGILIGTYSSIFLASILLYETS